MPPLLRQDGSLRVTAKEKTDILFNRFFTPSIADLSDVQEAFPPIFIPSLDTPLSSIIRPSPTISLISPTSPISPSSPPLPVSINLSPSSSSFYLILPFDYNISYKEVR